MMPYLLGLALCSRPIYLLVFPLVCRLLGASAAIKAGAVAFALAALSAYLGWGGHMISPQYAKITGGGMFVASLVLSAILKRERHVWLSMAALLMLPALWVTNAAYQVLLALPFAVMGAECEE